MNDTVGEPDVSALLALTSGGPETIERLRRKLEESAIRDGLLDIAYTTIDTPVGSLLLAATDKGLVRVAYDSEDHDAVLDTLATRSARGSSARRDAWTRPHAKSTNTSPASRTRFDLTLDLSLSSGFRQVVQRYLPEIGYGHTQSYAQSPSWSATRRLSAPSAPPAPPTRCLSSCPATGCSAPMARSVATSAASPRRWHYSSLEAAS